MKHKPGVSVAFVLACAFIGSAGYAQSGDLIETILQIEERLDARIGVTVYVPDSGQRWQYHADDVFPMSSTFKVLACAALLNRVDVNAESLDRIVTIREEELVSYSPVTATRVGEPGMTLAELCQATLSVSDNTAGNMVLKAIGGPDGLTNFMRSIGDEVTRLDRWETELNEALPGDARDTTSPNAMAAALEKLVLGDVLSLSSRRQLQSWMLGDTVGDALLRAGIPATWEIADKTGAGGHGSRSIAAIMWPPNGKPVIATVYITETAATMDESNSAIAKIGAAIANSVARLQPED